MKLIIVTTQMMARRCYVSDHAAADAAHAAIKAAMESYDKFGNDKSKTVTVAFEAGEQTFRLDDLVSVGIADLEKEEATMIEREVWHRQLEAKITARLAPQT